ncbi:Cathepsin_L [Hexamita inflata]|uniref:Cathepsin L n=1 Tax=Hexamita inflata TaxID=28002 RepID=A0AA86P5N7_9EUKA|nr:Cathepsin L [Hexamita inflata]
MDCHEVFRVYASNYKLVKFDRISYTDQLSNVCYHYLKFGCIYSWSNRNSIFMLSLRRKTNICQNQYCLAVDPIQSQIFLPESVDFRSLGLIVPQDHLFCDACWATVCTSVLNVLIQRGRLLSNSSQLQQDFSNIISSKSSENAIKSHQKIKVDNLLKLQLSQFKTSFSYSLPKEFDSVSVSFLLQNSFGVNRKCRGGDASVLLFQIENYFQTVESKANYPVKKFTQYQSGLFKDVSSVKFKPFASYKVMGKKNLFTPSIHLFQSYNRGFDQKAILRVKKYLALGYPVIGAMNYDHNFTTQYTGGIARKQCAKSQLDHQIMFAGYTRINNTEVWIIQNTKGDKWGHNGFFYIEIGSNAFCVEQLAIGVVAKTLVEETQYNDTKHDV